MAQEAPEQKAQRVIEAALREVTTELRLTSLGLTSVPEGLGQLTQLQTLSLSDNPLMTLPEGLGQLTQLRTLDLRDNQLTQLPPEIAQLKNLNTLNLVEITSASFLNF